MAKKLILSSALLLLLAACSSDPPKPPAPEWTHQGARAVDNGYIVYVAQSGAATEERAQFKAEGLALQDLANECSVIPKGTRVEDRFVTREKREFTAYVKIALEIQECDDARRANDPAEIRRVANLGFTEQLKRYQDLEETGELPPQGEVAALAPPSEVPPPPAREAGWDDSTHLYVSRQYVAYQKEAVVLSPPAAYAPGTALGNQFANNVTPSSNQIQAQEIKNPNLRQTTWSQAPYHPAAATLRPASFAPRASSAGFSRGLRPPSAERSSSAVRETPRGSGSGTGGHGAYGQRRGRRRRN